MRFLKKSKKQMRKQEINDYMKKASEEVDEEAEKLKKELEEEK